MDRTVTYDAVGATDPADAVWGPTPRGFRRHEETVWIGHGEQVWATAVRDLMAWQVKRRSGFEVSQGRVRLGDVELRARLGPFRVVEPARVVVVIEEADRAGFAYGTCEGHPVRGEEAFVLSRSADGSVDLGLRSLTAAPRGGPWRVAYPLALAAQPWYRSRYRRALGPAGGR